MNDDDENLPGILDTFKEHFSTKINSLDSKIQGAVKKDWLDYIAKTKEEQLARNRNIVEEVLETARKFSASINERFAAHRDLDNYSN